MKYLIFSILFLGLISSCENKTTSTSNSATPKKEVKKKPLSPPETAMAMVGGAHVHIDYSSPGVRGRTIFGDLIPYGKLWRAGANNATWLETNKDLLINEKTLPKGKYGVFLIPNEKSWTWIFNTNWNQHGTDKYKESEDVMRFDLPVIPLGKVQEHLEYKVEKVTDDSGKITAAWEKTKVEFPFKIIE